MGWGMTTFAADTTDYIQVRIGQLDRNSPTTWNCRVRSDHPAVVPFFAHLRSVLQTPHEWVVAYHFMPQVPSVQILAQVDEKTNRGDPAGDFMIFEDFEQIRYLPDKELLQLAKTVIDICGFHYTAFDLPVDDNAAPEVTSATGR